MGQSLASNHIHIIFSTKYRDPYLIPEFEERVHEYIGGICNKFDCPVIQVGGYDDHVHILCELSRKIALMTLVQKVKGNSSKWIKEIDPHFANFYWQDGYAAFSVGRGQINSLKNYIKNQRAHHERDNSFKEEYRSLLIENNVEFDEQYIWE